jgi:hypothetical protein
MKKNKKTFLVLATVLIGLVVYFFGLIFEYEYPYALTIMNVQRARVQNGDLAKALIAQRLGIKQSDVHFHRCSYCANYDSQYLNGMVRVQVGTYGFAFNRKDNELYSADTTTAKMFPEMKSISRK